MCYPRPTFSAIHPGQFLLRIWLVLVILFYALSLSAQDPYALKLDKSKGLPDNSVFNIKQDSRGFIWIASLEGLTQYDGIHFKTFYSESQTSRPGSAIQEDKYGRIWYENFDGYLYYVEQNSDSLKALNQEAPIGFLPYGLTDQYLFILQKNGIDVYNLVNLEKASSLDLALSEISSSCSAHNNLYFMNKNELYKIDNALKLKKVIYTLPEGEKTKQIYADEKGIFIASKFNENKAIHFFDKDLNFLASRNLPEPEVVLSASLVRDEPWIHTTTGSYALKKDGKIEHYFPTKSISCLFQDRQNNFWVATPNDGIFIAPKLNSPVHQLDGFQANKLVKFNESSFIIATKKGEIIQVDQNMRWQKTLYSSTDKSEITYLFLDQQKEFLAFSNLAFNALDLKTNQLKSSNIAIKELCEITPGLYGYSASGLFGILQAKVGLLDTSYWKNIKANYPVSFDDFYKIKENLRTRSTTYAVNSQTIYYATNIGLFAVGASEVKEIQHNNEAFLANKIISHGNELYALSSKGNLYRINSKNEFIALNEHFQLAPFSVRGLKLFESKLVFISEQFIHAIDLKTDKHTIYDINISTYEINDLYLDEENLYIVSNKGIIQLPSVNAPSDSIIAPLFHITKFLMGKQSLSLDKNHKFSYDENEIKIHFSLLDFGKINSASISYAINEKEWIGIEPKTRSLDFLELAPGSYTIQFRVNEQIQDETISFTISPPFWKRGSFIALLIGVVLILMYWFYHYRVKQLNQQIALLEANIQLEKNLSSSILTSIKAQMNPHFFYNALNTIQAYIFDNDKRNASKYLSKFSKLTRLILEMSEKETISIQEEVEALVLYLDLEKMRFSDDFNFEVNVDKNLDSDFCRIPSMLVQPYVENAVKHGLLHLQGTKKLNINFVQTDSFLQVTIEDNGIGRKKSMELNTLKEDKPASFSTNANEKRLAIINRNRPNTVSVQYEDLCNENGQVVGTKVILRIQLE